MNYFLNDKTMLNSASLVNCFPQPHSVINSCMLKMALLNYVSKAFIKAYETWWPFYLIR